jgi:hypothetical protein
VVSVEVAETVARTQARTTAAGAACPGCGRWSIRMQGSCLRFPGDLPTAGKRIVLSLRVRRFTCVESSCPRRTFAEQVPGLTRRYGGRKLRFRLASVGLAGRTGAQMADAFGAPVSRNALLRLIASLPDPPAATPRGWRGSTHPAEAGSTEPWSSTSRHVARWTCCRTARPTPGSLAGEAARVRDSSAATVPPAAPRRPSRSPTGGICGAALGEAAEKSVYRHRGYLRPIPGYGHGVIVALADGPPGRRTHTGQTRHHPRAPRRRTKLATYEPYLDQRWQEGCTNAWILWAEIKEQGYPDGYSNVLAYVSSTLRGKPQPVGPGRPLPARPPATPSSPVSPSPGTPVSSKAVSTGSSCSSCSSARCSAAQDSNVDTEYPWRPGRHCRCRQLLQEDSPSAVES